MNGKDIVKKEEKAPEETFVDCPGGCKDKNEKPLQIPLPRLIDHMAEHHPNEINMDQSTLTKLAQREIDKKTPQWRKLLDLECKADNKIFVVVISSTDPEGKLKFDAFSNGDILQMIGVLSQFLKKTT